MGTEVVWMNINENCFSKLKKLCSKILLMINMTTVLKFSIIVFWSIILSLNFLPWYLNWYKDIKIIFKNYFLPEKSSSTTDAKKLIVSSFLSNTCRTPERCIFQFKDRGFPLIKSNFDIPHLPRKRDSLLGERFLNHAAFTCVPQIHCPLWSLSMSKATPPLESQKTITNCNRIN